MSEEEKIILPDGYTRVEFLESFGVDYFIDTGIKPNQDTGSYIEAANTGGAGNCNVDGASGTFMTPHTRISNSGGYCYKGSWYSLNGYGVSKFVGTLNWLNSGIVSLSSSSSYSATLPPKTDFEASQNLYIFNPNGFNYDGHWKIYRYKISQGDEIILDFIPCLDASGVPCMYDIISKKSFYNGKSAKFGYKLITEDEEDDSNNESYPNQKFLPDGYSEVKWIYFNEQQYIKTNVFVTNNIGCKIKYTREKEFLGDENSADHILGARSLTGGAGIDNSFSPPAPTNLGKFYCNYGKRYAFDEECILYKPYEVELNYLNSSYASINNKKIIIERESFVEEKWPKINPLILGGFTNDQVSPYGPYNWKGRVYYCIITDGDKIIRHYIPCLNENNTLCFYDLINKTTHFSGGQPFQNYGLEDDNVANEEKFILPNGYTKVDYLQSSNSTSGEYGIDTGIKPNEQIGFYIEFKSIYDVTTDYQQTVFGASHKDRDRELQINHWNNGNVRFR